MKPDATGLHRSHYSFFASSSKQEAWRLASLSRYQEAYQLEQAALCARPFYNMRPMMHPPLNRVSAWTGESLEPGQLLFVHQREGFGDAFQFVRYLPAMLDRVGHGVTVLFAAPSWLLSLLNLRLMQGIRTLAVEEGGMVSGGLPFPSAVSCVMASPFLVGPLGMAEPYLQADQQKARYWRDHLQARFPGKKLVGVVGTASEGEAKTFTVTPSNRRTCPSSALARFVKELGETSVFFSLLKGLPNHVPGNAFLLPNKKCPLVDWRETAAIIAALDAVVSVDTAVCHLAGALGKPVFTLLSHSPDWRWGGEVVKQDTTPWYPTMRLFRQDKPGNWKHPIEQAIQRLREL